MVDMLEPVNRALWNSGAQILLQYRLDMFGALTAQRAGTSSIPVDIAAAVARVAEEEKATFASTILRVREIDEAVNAEVRAEAVRQGETPPPEGTSVFDSMYLQYLQLEAAPTVAEWQQSGWVWGNDMPDDMFLVNRLTDRTTLDNRMLERWGYVEAFENKRAGNAIIAPPNDEVIAKARRAREVLKGLVIPFDKAFIRGPLYKMSRADYEASLYYPNVLLYQKEAAAATGAAPLVVQAGSQTVTIILGIVALVIAAGVVFAVFSLPKMLQSANIDASLDAFIKSLNEAHAWNGKRVTSCEQINEQCLNNAAAHGSSAQECADMLDQCLPLIEPPDVISAISAIGNVVKCKHSDCWTWIGLGGTLGAVAGFIAANRLWGNR
jgi:hypothetical protein